MRTQLQVAVAQDSKSWRKKGCLHLDPYALVSVLSQKEEKKNYFHG